MQSPALCDCVTSNFTCILMGVKTAGYAVRILLNAQKSAYVFELALYLTFEGEQVTWAPSCDAALSLAATSTFDVMVAYSDGLTTKEAHYVSRMQAALNGTPILALYGAPRPDVSKAQTLETGIDRMFGPSVTNARVLARVRDIVRRIRGLSELILRTGIVRLDCGTQEVEVNGVPLELTPKELDVLKLLMLCTNTVLTKGEILAQLYDEVDQPSPKIVDVLICKVRSKLAQAGACDVISTIYGCGYTVCGVTKETGLHLCSTFSSRLKGRASAVT